MCHYLPPFLVILFAYYLLPRAMAESLLNAYEASRLLALAYRSIVQESDVLQPLLARHMFGNAAVLLPLALHELAAS